MSGSPALSAEFWELMNGAINGTLSRSELARLETRLDGDAELQKLYRDFCQLHVNLDAEIRSQRVINAFRSGDKSLADLLFDADYDAATTVDARTKHEHTHLGAYAVSYGMLACAAALAMVTIGALWYGAQRLAKPAVDDVADAELGQDIVTVRLASADSRYVPLGEVGSIHVQGPAHLELIGNSRARLHQGRIKVRISDPRGRGFVVETPQGNVTDLGTEFGVDVANGQNTGVVVFEGAVDLQVRAEGPAGVHTERLLQGEGLSVSRGGQLDRIMSIVTGKVATFQQGGEKRWNGIRPVIVDVADNIRSRELRKFYEIVPGGLQEDALAYVDRPAHDWSGVDEQGIPEYLLGADYVKPFNSDKMRTDVQISVTLSCPARLFVFADDRVTPPDWLRENFRDTGDEIGHDVGAYVLEGREYFKLLRGWGPGKSIDSKCSIWEQVVPLPATIELGPNSGSTEETAMYGIAAIRLDTAEATAAGDAEPSETGQTSRTRGGSK